MKINKLYLQDVLDKYEEIAGKPAEYCDDTGLYYLKEMNLIIKSWNLKLELNGGICNPKKIKNIFKLAQEMKYSSWLDFEEESFDEQD